MDKDDDLIQRCRADPAALRVLVERYQARLYSFLIRLAGRGAADDLFQEIWVKVFENADRYEPRGKAASWLFKIANNLAMNHWAKLKREGSVDIESVAERLVDSSQPEAVAQSAESSGKLAQAVAALPIEQRQVFLMREQGELSFREIAETLDIPLGTALSRMNYALEKLRDALEEYHA